MNVPILVVCPYLPDPPDHGGRIRSRVLVEALAGLGDVHLAVPAPEARALPGVAQVHPLPARAPSPPGPFAKVATWLRGASEVLGRRWGEGAPEALARVAAALRPELVVADSSFVLPVTRVLAEVQVLHLHNVESAALARDVPDLRVRDRVQRGLESWLVGHAEAAAARAARLVFTVSAQDRALLLRRAPGVPVEVVENSVDVAAIPCLPLPTSAAPLLLFVGSFEYPPNLEAARELLFVHLPVLRSAVPDLRVRVVGNDPDGVVAGWCRAAGAEAAGRVADLRPHYAAARCVYLPIRSGGGTRIKAIEALAYGRPVLATAVAVEGLGLEPGREYLPFETPQEGREALARALAAEAGALAERGRAVAEARFDHRAARARMRAVLAPLVARPA
ncbi:MAG: glycosyltransferase [Planctomycetes bacterium]|nr:glycosyltransferase [Planctomycetota bacterium]